MSITTYWEQVATERKVMAEVKPKTAAEVVAILNEHDPMSVQLTGDAFYSGGNDGGSLAEDLAPAGWSLIWSEEGGDYFYVIEHEETGDRLTYIEGDVYAGDHRPR